MATPENRPSSEDQAEDLRDVLNDSFQSEEIPLLAESLPLPPEDLADSAHFPKKILFLSASPDDQGRMQVDFEYQGIEAAMSREGVRDKFELLKPRFALDKSNYLKLSQQQAHIFHFAGHGGKAGIYIQESRNQAKLVPNLSIKLLGKRLQGTTELVVLNSCLSKEQAQLLSESVPYVVGTRVKIQDKLAVVFALGLYQGLVEGNQMLDSIRSGVNAVVDNDDGAAQHYRVWIQGREYRVV